MGNISACQNPCEAPQYQDGQLDTVCQLAKTKKEPLSFFKLKEQKQITPRKYIKNSGLTEVI